MRISSFIWILVLGGAGFSLFFVNYKVVELENKISKADKNIALTQNNIHLLKAEWSFLTSPERLASLSGQLLPAMHPISSSDILTFDRIPYRTTTVAQK